MAIGHCHQDHPGYLPEDWAYFALEEAHQRGRLQRVALQYECFLLYDLAGVALKTPLVHEPQVYLMQNECYTRLVTFARNLLPYPIHTVQDLVALHH